MTYRNIPKVSFSGADVSFTLFNLEGIRRMVTGV